MKISTFDSFIYSHVDLVVKNITKLAHYYLLDGRQVRSVMKKIKVECVDFINIEGLNHKRKKNLKGTQPFGMFSSTKDGITIYIHRQLRSQKKQYMLNVLTHEYTHAFQMIKSGYTNHDMEFLFMWWMLSDKKVYKETLNYFINEGP